MSKVGHPSAIGKFRSEVAEAFSKATQALVEKIADAREGLQLMIFRSNGFLPNLAEAKKQIIELGELEPTDFLFFDTTSIGFLLQRVQIWQFRPNGALVRFFHVPGNFGVSVQPKHPIERM